MDETSFFERTTTGELRPTRAVGGAWNPDEVHISPALGMILHEIERDARARRGDDALPISRTAFDIFGVFPLEPVRVAVDVVRPGRTIELVEATAEFEGRVVVSARAWMVRAGDTSAVEGTHHDAIPDPDAMPVWDAGREWPGGFIEAVEIRRGEWRPGRGAYWVRTDLDVVAGEESGPLPRAAVLYDISNGMVPRAQAHEVFFPNVDLTVHLFRQPVPGPVGFDTTVSFGPAGHGLTTSVLHDAHGPYGRVSQSLTVRPR